MFLVFKDESIEDISPEVEARRRLLEQLEWGLLPDNAVDSAGASSSSASYGGDGTNEEGEKEQAASSTRIEEDSKRPRTNDVRETENEAKLTCNTTSSRMP